ncbi:MAG: PKD domain-containing protein [Candidatus Micrarchaeota archaeon]
MEGNRLKAVTAVEFIMLAGAAVFMIVIISRFSVVNIFNPSMNQSNGTSSEIAEQKKCVLAGCADMCWKDGGTEYRNHSGTCVAGKCIYRGMEICANGCTDGYCEGLGPTADFTNSSQGGFWVRLASSAYDPDGKITEAYWDFGDGHTNTTLRSPVDHQYGAAGEYNVTLTVVDNAGNEDSVTKPVLAT